jgi:hypothetical protein
MVPTTAETVARDALAVLAQSEEESAPMQRTPLRDKLRMFLEFFFLGWFIPGRRPQKTAKRGGT